MWKYNGKIIREGSSWINSSGIKHPPNWQIWSAEEKAAAGLAEVTPETPPDSRLYTWSQNADGTINKKAKALNDTGSGDELVKGVKTSLKDEVNTQQGSILAATDWYVIRKVDKGTAIPDNVQEYRDAVRTKGDEMKAAIDDASDTDAIAALFVKRTTDESGNQTKTGILYDWFNSDN